MHTEITSFEVQTYLPKHTDIRVVFQWLLQTKYKLDKTFVNIDTTREQAVGDAP